MTNRQEIAERRKHRRFQARDGAFAVLMPDFHQWGQLIDISTSGLAFRYATTSEQASNGSSKLGILLASAGFCLRKVPFKAISDFEIAHEDDYLLSAMRRCSVEFAGLTLSQVSQLEYFIQNHTTDEL
ncbi:MAG: PilZ domain-containing protein [Deltaproteobacteria bacterium]|nr:PilZ domain-containing protein [Deltaproteobacteria bacterium]